MYWEHLMVQNRIGQNIANEILSTENIKLTCHRHFAIFPCNDRVVYVLFLSLRLITNMMNRISD